MKARGETLVPIINLSNRLTTVPIGAEFRSRARDLLSDRMVELKSLTLEPSVPMLLRLGPGKVLNI